MNRVSKQFLIIFLILFSSNLLQAQQSDYKVYPVLMVHGIFGTFTGWEKDEGILGYTLAPWDPKTISFLNNLYSCYSDRNTIRKPSTFNYPSALRLTHSELGNLSIFGLQYTKPNGPIFNNADELDKIINGYKEGNVHYEGIREIMSNAYPGIFPDSESVKVVIIAHSMGGLSSRVYIQDHPSDHHVAKLITVATPHLGSDLMNVFLVQPAKLAISGGIMIWLGSTFPTNIVCWWMVPYATGFIFPTAGWIGAIGGVFGASTPFWAPGLMDMHPFFGNVTGLLAYNDPAYHPIPTNLDYRLITGRLGEGWRIGFQVADFFLLGTLPSSLKNGDIWVSVGSGLATGESIFETPFPNGVDVLKNSPHWLVEDRNHGSIMASHAEILKALEDPPVISNISFFTADSKSLVNNALQDINEPGIIITGNLWDYLLHKLNAKISFSHKLPQTINFDAFGHFSENVALPVGGKNTLSVSASNLANYYAFSSPHNIYLVGISYPRDGMILMPENSAGFQYSTTDTFGNIITTEIQSLAFTDYGGVLPEQVIELSETTEKIPKPRYPDGTVNSDIAFTDTVGSSLPEDPSTGDFIVGGLKSVVAKLNNSYKGRTFVRVQGNADANQWSGYNIEIGKGENPTIWDVKNNFGEQVASGVYIYFLTDDTKEKKIGKIVVIR